MRNRGFRASPSPLPTCLLPICPKPLLYLFDKLSHVQRAKEKRLEPAAFQSALHARSVTRDDPDGDARGPVRQTLHVCRGVVAGRDVSDKKCRAAREKFESGQSLCGCLIGFHADAFLHQLRSKQRACLPVLTGYENLAHKHII